MQGSSPIMSHVHFERWKGCKRAGGVGGKGKRTGGVGGKGVELWSRSCAAITLTVNVVCLYCKANGTCSGLRQGSKRVGCSLPYTTGRDDIICSVMATYMSAGTSTCLIHVVPACGAFGLKYFGSFCGQDHCACMRLCNSLTPQNSISHDKHVKQKGVLPSCL